MRSTPFQAFFLFTLLERPIVSYDSGIATATLRVRDGGNPDYTEHLRDAFIALFALYGANSYFDVNVVANVVLQGNTNQRYSVFYGQDYGNRDFSLSDPEVVRNLGDVGNLRTDYTANDFENVFYANFDDTDVTVHSVINLVWVITKYLDNFERDKTVGQRLTRVF